MSCVSACVQNYTHTWFRNIAEGEAPVIQSPLGCLTPATGISVVASSPIGAPSAAPALLSASAAAPSPSGMSPMLATIVDGNTTTLVSCPAAAAVDPPTICPFVQPCNGATPATLMNSTVSSTLCVLPGQMSYLGRREMFKYICVGHHIARQHCKLTLQPFLVVSPFWHFW